MNRADLQRIAGAVARAHPSLERFTIRIQNPRDYEWFDKGFNAYKLFYSELRGSQWA